MSDTVLAVIIAGILSGLGWMISTRLGKRNERRKVLEEARRKDFEDKRSRLIEFSGEPERIIDSLIRTDQMTPAKASEKLEIVNTWLKANLAYFMDDPTAERYFITLRDDLPKYLALITLSEQPRAIYPEELWEIRDTKEALKRKINVALIQIRSYYRHITYELLGY